MTFSLFSEPTRAEHLCESSEWYTPTAIVEAARAVLGAIDLDPATCVAANRNVRATNIYTVADDGLDPANAWNGRVFLNPPNPAGPFWKRLVADHAARRVSSAVYVAYSIEQLQQVQAWTPAAPLSSWPICIARRRVRFLQESEQVGLDGERSLVPGASPTHASAIVGVGVDVDRFRTAFAGIGLCR